MMSSPPSLPLHPCCGSSLSLYLTSFLLWWPLFHTTSTSACWSWYIPHLSISYSFVLLLPHTSVSVPIGFYLIFSFLRLLSHAFFLHFSVLLHLSLTSSAWKPLVFLNIWKWDNPTKHAHTNTQKQQLRHANVSQNTYSLPHTHHHTIKCKSLCNSCCVSVCMSICQLIVFLHTE